MYQAVAQGLWMDAGEARVVVVEARAMKSAEAAMLAARALAEALAIMGCAVTRASVYRVQ